jgi:hypothetical protein
MRLDRFSRAHFVEMFAGNAVRQFARFAKLKTSVFRGDDGIANAGRNENVTRIQVP